MPDTVTLSEPALALLRLALTNPAPPVTSDNREAYRELARAGIMVPVSGFVHGPEAYFRFTEEGWNRREEFLNADASLPPR